MKDAQQFKNTASKSISPETRVIPTPLGVSKQLQISQTTVVITRAAETTDFKRLQFRLRPGNIDSDSSSESA